jgi:anti-sigma regulatory factor (Ser/Thr protein kinase)
VTGTGQRRTFPSTPTSAGEARRFVASVLTEAHLEDLAYSATMLVSELVTNALLHTATPIAVVVRADGDRVRVEVHDGSPQLPVRKHYSSMSGTGRGLVLVERMASGWGADPTEAGGKVVWFELDRSTAPAFDFLELDVL